MSTLKVAVTGAGGFIGGRTCEYLAAGGFEVHPLVRTYASAARLSIWPLPVAKADVMDPASLEEAFKGMDVVVHCAYGNTDDVAQNEVITRDGTANVVAAAKKSGVRRLVQMSTVAVYGGALPEVVTEATPYPETEDWYARSKQQAEKLAFQAADDNFEVVALQPAIVYGPWASIWTVEPVERLLSGNLVLYDGGSGICNTLYIDNLAQAIALACVKEGVSGETFLINDGAPVTWKQFYGYYARMCARELPEASVQDVQATEQKRRVAGPVIKGVQTVGKAGAAALMAVGLGGLAESGKRSFKKQTQWMTRLSTNWLEFYTIQSSFDISKARAGLGYTPEIPLEKGMELTHDWLRFARVCPV